MIKEIYAKNKRSNGYHKHVWTGKTECTIFEVPTVSMYKHEISASELLFRVGGIND